MRFVLYWEKTDRLWDKMQYCKARQDEVWKVTWVCADAFEDYPYLSMNTSNLKNSEQFDEFVLALQKILIRFAIKMDSYLVAEEDGHIVAAAILHSYFTASDGIYA